MVNVTTGWQPTCGCPLAEPVPCTVLDPFGGAGTTGMVAQRLGRDAILLELNPDYAAMAEKRLAADRGELPIEGVGLFGRVA
jgi:DNA modification methylase